MEPWQTLLLALGGNSVSLAILAWLARSFGSQLFEKDIERFKSELSTVSSKATEQLRHDLHLVATEHEVRFSKLHERRAEVVAELYDLLVEAQWAFQSFVSPAEFAGEPKKPEKYAEAMQKSATFYRFFDKSRIYLPQKLCNTIDTFLKNMRAEVTGFGAHISMEQHFPNDVDHKAKFAAWIKASEYFDTVVPESRAALEEEFRLILGAAREIDR